MRAWALLAVVLLAAPAWADHLLAGWQAATALETAPGPVTEAAIGMDAQGRAVAVWLQEADDRDVWSNRFTPQKGWGTAHLLELTVGDAAGLVLDVHASGTAVAAWRQWDGTRFGVWASYDDGDGWGLPKRLDNATATTRDLVVAAGREHAVAVWEQDGRILAAGHDGAWTTHAIDAGGDGPAGGPAVAMDDAGRAVVVWHHTNGTQAQVWGIDGAGTWGIPRALRGVAAVAERPVLSMDPRGDAMAVWVQGGLWAVRYVGGLGWDLPQPVASGAISAPMLGWDGAGSFFVAWIAGQTVWASRHRSGWENGTQLDPDPTPGIEASLAVSRDGTAIVAWHAASGTTSDIRTSRYAGGTWTGPTTIDDRAGGAYQPYAGLDARGNAIVTWRQADAIGFHGYAANRTAGWSSPRLIETTAGEPGQAQVVFDPDGNAMALWTQRQAERTDLWANRFVTARPPPALTVSSAHTLLTQAVQATITGTTEPRAALTLNGQPLAMGAGGAFATAVTLSEGPNVFTVRAADLNGDATTVSVTLTRDTTPPRLVLLAPDENATLHGASVLVRGQSEKGTNVTVRGMEVQVGNDGSFSHRLALGPGRNSIPVTAVDAAGNVVVVTRNVTYAPAATSTTEPAAPPEPDFPYMWAAIGAAVLLSAAAGVAVIVARRRRADGP